MIKKTFKVTFVFLVALKLIEFMNKFFIITYFFLMNTYVHVPVLIND